MDPEQFHALPKSYRFEDYEIVRVLGQGGFGITYLGYDDNLKKPVAIKEYLPVYLAVRDATNSVVPRGPSVAKDFKWGLDRFLDEAQTLARFRHLNLIQVLRFFRANKTGYIVMEYAEGETLADLLNRKNKLTHDELWPILEPLLSGLEALHSHHFMHRDIKPSNIIIRDDGAPVLIDFGAARHAVGSKSQTLTAIVTPRFAPLEQYSSDGDQGPWTDIYALGAVAYRALTDKLPPDPTQRMPNDPFVPAQELAADQAPEGFLKAVDWALALFGADRPQSIAEWREALKGGEVKEKPAPKEPAAPPKTPEPIQLPKRSRSGLYWGVAVALLVAIGGAASYYYWPSPGEPGFGLGRSKPASLIKEAQGLFNRLGYEVGPPTGEMSPRTEAAVRNFERDQGLIEVGAVDALLIQKLKAEQAAWKQATAEGTVAAYRKYLQDHPKGPLARETQLKFTPFELTWEKTLGGANTDYVRSIVALADGGFAVAGYTESKGAGGADVWVLRLDRTGELLWEKTFGGAKPDYAHSIIALPDGGFVVAGDTHSKGTGEYDAWILRLDETGELLWEKTFGGTEQDEAHSIIALTDGGFAVAGYTLSIGAGRADAWILRLDRTGGLLWENTFGGSASDKAYSIVALADGGFVVAGSTESKGAGSFDAWILRLDGAGRLLWEKTFGGAKPDYGHSFVALADGGFVVAGDTHSKGTGEYDAWILRLDETGELLWEKTFGGREQDEAHSIIALTDGGFAVAGSTKSKGAGDWDFWILRLDRTGGLLWEKTFGGREQDEAHSIIALTDGRFVVAGYTASKGAGSRDAWILGLDPPQ